MKNKQRFYSFLLNIVYILLIVLVILFLIIIANNTIENTEIPQQIEQTDDIIKDINKDLNSSQNGKIVEEYYVEGCLNEFINVSSFYMTKGEKKNYLTISTSKNIIRKGKFLISPEYKDKDLVLVNVTGELKKGRIKTGESKNYLRISQNETVLVNNSQVLGRVILYEEDK